MSLTSILNIKSTHTTPSTPGLVEIGELLNQFPGAALLLNREQNRVILSNSSLIQLTAFAQDEICQKSLSDLVPGLVSTGLLPGEEKTCLLARRMREAIPVIIKTTILDAGNQWLLITFSPVQGKHETPLLQETFFKALIELNSVDQTEGQLFKDALSIAQELIQADTLCLYLAQSEAPQLEKIAEVETGVTLPQIIPSTDLIRLRGDVNWHPGKKVITELHRQARIMELNSVLSAPLGDARAHIGLIVAATRKKQFNEVQINTFYLIASMINSQMQNQILTNNLRKEKGDVENQITIWKSIFENAKQGIFITSPDLKINYINPSAEVMLGYVDWEVQDQLIENILIGPDSLPLALGEAGRGITSPDIGTAQVHRRDGSSFPAQIQIVPIQQGQTLLGILLFITDISEHEQIRVQSQQLEHRALLGEVMGVFAHEVRNPVNNIYTGLQLWASRLQPEDPSLESISRMQGDCVRVNELMESVLAFSRPIETKLKPLNLDMLLRRIVDRWHPRMAKVNVKLHLQIAEGLPNIAGDNRTLEQVFTNLISNAIDAMSKTGGNLSIKAQRFDGVENLPQVEVTIADDGPGIPDELKDRIFEPFVTNKANGTGLGLPIVKQIITAHHGSIVPETFPGGTVFHVFLNVHNGE